MVAGIECWAGPSLHLSSELVWTRLTEHRDNSPKRKKAKCMNRLDGRETHSSPSWAASPCVKRMSGSLLPSLRNRNEADLSLSSDLGSFLLALNSCLQLSSHTPASPVLRQDGRPRLISASVFLQIDHHVTSVWAQVVCLNVVPWKPGARAQSWPLQTFWTSTLFLVRLCEVSTFLCVDVMCMSVCL